MCGIFGFTNVTPDTLLIGRKALHSLAHRGPNSHDERLDDYCYLGHRRLSILDLSPAGAQPMMSHDGKVCIICNGEIYNFKHLRSILEKSHSFRGNSDSEVVLHGYREWGIDGLVAKLDGMYAIAIYDQAKQEIYLVRDRVGIKPLYWSFINQRLAWASELKALSTFHEKDSLKLDHTALFDYYNYLYIPSPKTIYKDVYKLEPAHYLRYNISSKNWDKRKYWALNDAVASADKKLWDRSVTEIIDEAVLSHLQSDVPVGVFLSGGIDSSIVAATTRKFTNQNLMGFTIDVPGSEQDQVLSRKMATFLNIDHHTKDFSESDVKDLYGLVKKLFDEPFADTSCFPMFKVSELARKNGIKVVLSGDGGDELFYGYKWYQKAERGLFQPKWYRKTAKDLLKGGSQFFKSSATFEPLIRYQEWLGAPSLDQRIKLAAELNIPSDYDNAWFFRLHDRKDLKSFERWRWLDFHCYLPEDILTKVDRATMAVGVESRVPLLDLQLVTYAFGLKENDLKTAEGLKTLLKNSYKGILPEEVINQDKKGFSIPVKAWGTYGKDLPKQIGIFKNEFEKTFN